MCAFVCNVKSSKKKLTGSSNLMLLLGIISDLEFGNQITPPEVLVEKNFQFYWIFSEFSPNDFLWTCIHSFQFGLEDLTETFSCIIWIRKLRRKGGGDSVLKRHLRSHFGVIHYLFPLYTITRIKWVATIFSFNENLL